MPRRRVLDYDLARRRLDARPRRKRAALFRTSNLRLSISIDGVADGLTDHVDCRVFRDVVTTTPPPMVNAPINEMAVRGDVARRDLLRDVDGTPAFWILETGAH
jgi:hypothetical protein